MDGMKRIGKIGNAVERRSLFFSRIVRACILSSSMIAGMVAGMISWEKLY